MHTQTNGSCTSNNGADRGGGEVDSGTVALPPGKTMDGGPEARLTEQPLYSQACRNRDISSDGGESGRVSRCQPWMRMKSPVRRRRAGLSPPRCAASVVNPRDRAKHHRRDEYATHCRSAVRNRLPRSNSAAGLAGRSLEACLAFRPRLLLAHHVRRAQSRRAAGHLHRKPGRRASRRAPRHQRRQGIRDFDCRSRERSR